MMDHPFEVGGRYQNEKGDYEVLAIEGERMLIRYADGTEQYAKISIQARIWQRILDEADPPLEFRSHESKAIQPIVDLVSEVLLTNFEAPHPPDITDQVCLAIETDPTWRERYNVLTQQFDSADQSGVITVNQAIGYYTKELTGMATVRSGVKAKSNLIKSYSELGDPDLPAKD